MSQVRQYQRVSTYRVAEAAEVLGVSNDTLRRWIEAGRVAAAAGDDGKTRIAGSDGRTVRSAEGPEGCFAIFSTSKFPSRS